MAVEEEERLIEQSLSTRTPSWWRGALGAGTSFCGNWWWGGGGDAVSRGQFIIHDGFLFHLFCHFESVILKRKYFDFVTIL